MMKLSFNIQWVRSSLSKHILDIFLDSFVFLLKESFEHLLISSVGYTGLKLIKLNICTFPLFLLNKCIFDISLQCLMSFLDIFALKLS